MSTWPTSSNSHSINGRRASSSSTRSESYDVTNLLGANSGDSQLSLFQSILNFQSSTDFSDLRNDHNVTEKSNEYSTTTTDQWPTRNDTEEVAEHDDSEDSTDTTFYSDNVAESQKHLSKDIDRRRDASASSLLKQLGLNSNKNVVKPAAAKRSSQSDKQTTSAKEIYNTQTGKRSKNNAATAASHLPASEQSNGVRVEATVNNAKQSTSRKSSTTSDEVLNDHLHKNRSLESSGSAEHQEGDRDRSDAITTTVAIALASPQLIQVDLPIEQSLSNVGRASNQFEESSVQLIAQHNAAVKTGFQDNSIIKTAVTGTTNRRSERLASHRQEVSNPGEARVSGSIRRDDSRQVESSSTIAVRTAADKTRSGIDYQGLGFDAQSSTSESSANIDSALLATITTTPPFNFLPSGDSIGADSSRTISNAVSSANDQSLLPVSQSHIGINNNAGVGLNIAGLSSSSASNSATKAPTTSSGNTSAGEGLTKYQAERVLQRALHGIDVSAADSGPVRIRLHPPELGSLQVTLKVEANQVTATIEVEHSGAKDALLENTEQLVTSLKEKGFEIASFDVNIVDAGSFTSDAGGFSSTLPQHRDSSETSSDERQNSRIQDRIRNRRLGEANSSDPLKNRPSLRELWTRNHSQLDVSI